DHTFVQRLIDEGRLRPEEAETHPHKNVLMRVLGDVDASPELDLATLEVEPGERWLLCSDGLNYVAGHVVERTVRETKSLRECAELLVDLTLDAGAPDNVTVVMLEIVEQTTDDVRTAAVEIVPSMPPSTVAATVSEGVRQAGNTFGAAKTAEALPKTPGPTAAAAIAAAAAATPAPSTAEDSRPDAGAAAGQPAGNSPETGELPTSTDPHLGEHLSAEVLREELAGRPHELVGAAAAAAESGSIPTIAGRTMARRAATVLTHKSEQAREEAEEYRQAGRPRRWVTVSIAAAIVAFLTVGLWLGYAWTQTRYYIGEHDQHVAIFNGVSQRLGPIQLSTLEAVTEIRMSDLPEFSQQRVRQTVPARDLYDAQRIVKNLERTGTTAPADECITPSPIPATPGATADPSATAGPGATASPGAAGTAAPSPAATAPVCEVGK
ncbi:MAG TPA: serine/threonine-protein phosphatase, partial [Arthrobacter sp.]|nr:serine/threonine-protein phosphatase [Arthrobacter sp.]